MGAYILRRLLLVIPTLIGIMVVNFTLTQFVPGGPFDQIEARMEGEGDSLKAISGDSADAGSQASNPDYIGGRGLPPEFRAQLEVEFGFARFICPEGFEGTPLQQAKACKKEMIPAVERFFIMMGHYIRFDFGQSYFRSTGVLELILEKMPVSITLGLWSTLIAYMVSIPLGIRKAMKDGSSFDGWTSGVIVAAYAIPGFLFAVLLMVLFARLRPRDSCVPMPITSIGLPGEYSPTSAVTLEVPMSRPTINDLSPLRFMCLPAG